jgi:5-oxoprolinase (ATP-hydrolysing)
VAKRPDRQLLIHKLLSKNAECYSDAPVRLIREILRIQFDTPIPADEIAVVKMATTVATNAALERKGNLTVLAKDFGMRYESVTKTVPISLPVRLFCHKCLM